ncbi:MAG TPA: hypothetical protein VFX70_05145 [Mycobacteriales bacterium]|nr:hypothetical protein [Mycobacteriales bacterium]
MPDVVLRPCRGSCLLTVAPAFVSVTDEHGTSRSFPRDGQRGVSGAATRLCARVAADPPGLVLPEIAGMCLLDGRGAVLATLDWDGNDHEAVEAGCATARLPLDRVPVAPADGGGRGGVAGGTAGRTVR